MKPYTIALFGFCLSFSLTAQKFLKKKGNEKPAFTEMQRQFSAWSKSTELKKEKGWKYFKRWEADMQMHTNAKGEPADPSIFIYESVKAAKEKEFYASSKTAMTAWYPVGPTAVPNNQTGYMENGIGRINCVAFHPTDPSTYFVGVAQGGVWKTTNNGVSWIPLTDNLPITRISDISIDPGNPDIIYVSVCDFEYIGISLNLNGRKRNTHYGLGVYKTTDGGITWNPTGLSFQLTDGDASLIRKVIVNSANGNKLVACGANGMYTSNDAGITWTKNLDSLFWDLVQDPVNINILYAASGWVKNANDGYAAIYKSIDFGATWSILNTGIPGTGTVQRVKLAIAPSDNNYVYALAVDEFSGLYGFYKSTDAGVNWNYINPGLNILEYGEGFGTGGQGNYDLGFMVNAANRELVYAGGINLWGSVDGCQTFNPISHWTTNYGPTIHADIHYMEQQKLTGNFFVCTDGGIYRTSDIVIGNWADANNGIPWPTQWTNINDGMCVTSFYRLSSSKSSTGRLLGGAQDNATFYYDGTAWSTVFGGDGMDNYLDPADDNFILGSSQYGNFYYSTDGGPNWYGTTANINSENAEWTSPLIADYNSPGVLYAGFENVTMSYDGGYTWSAISNFPSGFYPNEISTLAVSNSNSNVIYAGKRVRYEYSVPGSVYKTNDGGATWIDITAGLPDSLYYTSIEISETDENIAYISMAQFSAGNKIFKTGNGGATWQNISYNLPNLPVNCVKYIPGTEALLAATDIGIYILESGSTVWENKSSGLPNVIVSDIEFNETLNKAYICTFGRGIWATDLNLLVSSLKDKSLAGINFNLYPTVNNGFFTIDIQGNTSKNKELKLEVVDITGRIVHTSMFKEQNIHQPRLNLANGMYFAKVIGQKLIGVKSFIVK